MPGGSRPARAAARGVTVLEAICGQFYISVLIAHRIGKKVGGAGAGGPAVAPAAQAEGVAVAR